MTSDDGVDVFLRALRRSGVTLEAKGDRLAWTAPAGVMTPGLLGDLAREKPRLLAALRRESQGWRPLAAVQRHLYVQELLAPGRSGLAIPAVVRLAAEFDVSALQDALDALVARHDALRMVFEVDRDTVVQRARAEVEVPLAVRRADDQADAMRLLVEDASRPFDLARGPTLRALVVRYGTGESLIQLTFHHISCDEWSLRMALDEVLAGYAARASGRAPPTTEDPGSYRKYAAESSDLGRRELGTGMQFWRDRLAHLPPFGPAPEGPANPAVVVGDSASVTALRGLAAAERTTFNGVALAVVALVAGGFLERDDVVIGMPFDGRGPEYRRTVGTFVNTLPVRVQWAGSATLRSLVRVAGTALLESLEHGHAPYHSIIEAVRPGGGVRDLFDAWLVVREPRAALSIPGLSLRAVDVTHHVARHPLKVDLEVGPEGLEGAVLGRPPAWSAAITERFAAEVTTALTHAAALADLPLQEARAAIRRGASELVSRRRDDDARLSRSRLLTSRRSRG